MPTYLRRFYIKLISDENKKKHEDIERAKGREDLTTKKFTGKRNPNNNPPSLTPNYSKSKPYLSKPRTK